MKKCGIVFLAVLFVFTLCTSTANVFADETYSVSVRINGEFIKTDVSPFVENGRTLVPVRVISEYLKYEVRWFEDEQKVEIKSDSDSLVLYIGSADYYKNGEKKTMDVPARVKNDRTVVPVRLVAEEFGCEVEWDEDSFVADIIKYNVVEAKTAKDLLENAKSYTKIVLTGKEYNLTKIDLADITNPAISEEEMYNGYQYLINDVSHLIVYAPENTDVSVVTECSYANVLSFVRCDGIVVKNITAGHKTEKSTCIGGVIMLDRCFKTRIEKCRLYGCGTYGIIAEESGGIAVNDTEIYECSYGITDIRNSNFINFKNCIFRDTDGFSMFELNKCNEIHIEDSIIKNNKNTGELPCVYAYDCQNIVFKKCKFEGNCFGSLCNDENVEFVEIDFKN